MFDFTDEQIKRYSRHIVLPEVGGKGQKKIAESKVFLVGAGGLGSPSGYYLTAAGVGKIGIADSDTVELSNLQRQILHQTGSIGKPKVESARETLQALNPGVEIATYNERLTSENILGIIEDYDVVMDGSDNFGTFATGWVEAKQRTNHQLAPGHYSLSTLSTVPYVSLIGGSRAEKSSPISERR